MKKIAETQLAMVVQNDDIGTGTTFTHRVELPTAFPISRLWMRERATHATSITLTQDRISVIGDGSPLLSGLSGADLRKITKYLTGRDFAAPAAGTESIAEHVIHFGDFPGDQRLGLPAPEFSNLELEIEGTLDATPATHVIDVAVEEILGVDSKGMAIRKWSLVKTFSPSADDQTDVKLPRGNTVSAVYVDYADVDNIDGAALQLGANNFTRRLIVSTRRALEALNRQEYPFDDDTIPATMIALPLSKNGHPGFFTGPGSRVSDFQLRTKAAGSGTSGTVRVIAEELIAASG